MTSKQLNRGNEITSEIKQLEEQFAKWQKADKIKAYCLQLATADDYSNIDVMTRNIDFAKIKADAIDVITLRINRIEN